MSEPGVSSVFRHLAVAAADVRPRTGAALLGARWGFGVPATLTESTLPAGPRPYAGTIRARTGLRVAEHGPAEAHLLAGHLATGRAAVVHVDVFHLRHRPAYGRVHSARTILVRAGADPGSVLVDDPWPPAYAGPVPVAMLERARRSAVPLDPVREPLYAGVHVRGEWLAVDAEQTAIRTPEEWAVHLLRAVQEDAAAPAPYGLAALADFRDAVLGGAPARDAALVLRAELSSRVHLAALLRAAARWLADPRPADAADAYLRDLRSMALARDLLAKEAGAGGAYRALAGDLLAVALDADLRLAAAIGTWAGVAEEVAV